MTLLTSGSTLGCLMLLQDLRGESQWASASEVPFAACHWGKETKHGMHSK